MKITFFDYEIEVTDDPTYSRRSTGNISTYNFVYQEEAASEYQSSNHAIKLFLRGELVKSALVCALPGYTTVHKNSVVLKDDKLYVACGDKIFSISLPDLKLMWITQVDQATCFGIYKADDGLFTHGELSVTRLGGDGKVIWQTGLRDVIVTIDSDKDSFIMHDDYMELEDFERNNYKLGFDGKFIEGRLSDKQIHYDRIEKRKQKKWWEIW